LGNNLETNNERTSAARQQNLNKPVYAAVTKECLHKQTLSQGNDWDTTINGLFYMVRAKELSMGQV
jgi:hypothetical protein